MTQRIITGFYFKSREKNTMTENDKSSRYKIISLNIAKRGSVNHVSRVVESNLKLGIKIFKIRNIGKSDSAYPSMCVPVSALLDYYTKEKGCVFLKTQNLAGSYLGHTSFISPKEYRNEDIYRSEFLDRVWKFTSKDIDKIVSGIVHSLRTHAKLVKGVLPSIELCLNEVMDNVINHSLPSNEPVENAVGYVMAQYHQDNRTVAFTIHDNGQGILKSFEGSKYSPANEDEAIQLAISRNITSGNGAGRGLWMLSQLIKDNCGLLEISTGKTRVTFDHIKDNESSEPVISKIATSISGGTTIDFRITVDKEINVENALFGYIPTDLWEEDHELNENTLVFEIAKESQGTGTRYAANRLRNVIRNAFEQSGKKILIDFDSTSIVTSSYADELLGKMIEEVGFVKYMTYFSITNVSPINEMMINEALKRHFNIGQ